MIAKTSLRIKKVSAASAVSTVLWAAVRSLAISREAAALSETVVGSITTAAAAAAAGAGGGSIGSPIGDTASSDGTGFFSSILAPDNERQDAVRAGGSSGSNGRGRLRRSLQEVAGKTTAAAATTTSQETKVQEYELWKPEEIRERLYRWEEHYSDLIRLTTSQDAYGLPTAGGPADCPFEGDNDGCLNYVLTIQDYVSHPEGSNSSNGLPEVLWSGEVHGNERVGPTAVLEAAQLLMDAATCESLPRESLSPATTTAIDPRAWENELGKAKSCRQELRDFGISDDNRRWLARLVSTRRIVIVPTANSLGYYRQERTEDGVDPNRDFPYDLTDPTVCMKTIAGRTLNEVFREHMFQLSLTFHGGMEVIGYEWGAPTYDRYTSPDDTAQHSIAAAYSRFGGGWSGTPPYDFGAMNPKVYPVRGGMEDWAYAASWDPDRVLPCEPASYGGYPKEKTMYDESNLRVFNMLVETSNHKIPDKSELGSSFDLMTRTSKGNGHVARNIRLALLSADLVQPYVSIKGVNELTLSDDVIPMQDPSLDDGRTSCRKTKAVTVPSNSRKIVIEWTVGGALEIDNTDLWYAKWSNVPADFDCSSHPTNVETFMKKGTPIGPSTGTGRFSTEGPSPPFSASFEIDTFKPHDEIVVVASARVDQSWKTQQEGDRIKPEVPPQSHVVNARTNPDWRHEHNDKVIQGRLDWFSIPLTVVIGEYQDAAGAKGFDNAVATIELSNRFGEPTADGTRAGFTPKSVPAPWTPVQKIAAAVVSATVAFLVFVAGRAYANYRIRAARRDRVREFIHDESAPQPGLAAARTTTRIKANGAGYADIADHDDDDDDDNEEDHNDSTEDVSNGGHVEMRSYRDNSSSSSTDERR